MLAGACRSAPRPKIEFATESWSADGFVGRRLTSEHFEILSTLTDASFEAALPGFMEAAFGHYQRTLPLPIDPAHKLTVYLFGSRREWAAFARRRYPGRFSVYARIRAGGFTEGATSVCFYADRATTLATLAHEGWHQYVGSYLDRSIPAWLNEGLACYHETLESAPDGYRWSGRRNSLRIEALRNALIENRLLSLSELVDADAGRMLVDRDSRKVQSYYAQAWALITFLRESEARRDRKARNESFDRMLADLVVGRYGAVVSAAKLTTAGGSDMSDGRACLIAYFEASPEDLDDDYFDYVVRVSGY